MTFFGSRLESIFAEVTVPVVIKKLHFLKRLFRSPIRGNTESDSPRLAAWIHIKLPLGLFCEGLPLRSPILVGSSLPSRHLFLITQLIKGFPKVAAAL